MFKVEAVAKVHYTCTISGEDEKKVLDYINRNKNKMPFMSEKKMIEHVVEKLDECGEIELYKNSEETFFSTYQIKYPESEQRKEEEIIITQKTKDAISNPEELDNIFREMFSHFNSHHSKILKNYEMTSDEKREKLLRKSYVLINEFLENGTKPIYYTSEELAIFCLMIKMDWQYLKKLQNWG